MQEARNEIETKLAATQARLKTTLEARAKAEQAVDDAKATLCERQALLQTILKEEGELNGTLGELEKMLAALDATDR